MSKPLSVFIESVNASLCAVSFQANISRMAASASEQNRPPLPPRSHMARRDPVKEAAESAAAAIYAAESAYASACLQLLADGEGEGSEAEVSVMKDAADAVMALAGSSLRGLGIWADRYTLLGKLIARAERREEDKDDGGDYDSPFAPRLAPRLTPRLAPNLTSRPF